MSLVRFDDEHRRAWMFPRNIRKIYPWKVSQILSMIHMQLENTSWSGNQGLQDTFTQNLENFGLKRPGEQYDPHSGGARTYFAQLESLGLLFTREVDSSTWLTIAGSDLVESNYAPGEIIRTQLLNYQYPSVYSQGSNVKIHPKIKVKPFMFILELLMDSDVEYLTDNEIIIPVIYGHNHDCFELCKEKILSFRDHGQILSVIDDPNNDFFTPRTRGREIDASLADFKNIANTCKNFLESCSLVVSEKVVGERNRRIIFNDGVLAEVEKAMQSKKSFIPIRSKESFQRKYGAWNRTKDTRRLTQQADNVHVSRGEPIIRALFAEYAGNNLVLDDLTDFINQTTVEHGFDSELIRRTIQPYLVNSLSLYEQSFIGLSTGGTSTANEFEKAVKRLFEERLHYTATHTGQRHRPGEVGGYSDIFIQESTGRYCAIIDTKASPKYNISSADYHTMTSSYIPSINQLNEYNGESLGFCAYVAGGFVSSIKDRVIDVSESSGQNFATITAYDLLKLCQSDIRSSQEHITDVFMQKKHLEFHDFRSTTVN